MSVKQSVKTRAILLNKLGGQIMNLTALQRILMNEAVDGVITVSSEQVLDRNERCIKNNNARYLAASSLSSKALGERIDSSTRTEATQGGGTVIYKELVIQLHGVFDEPKPSIEYLLPSIPKDQRIYVKRFLSWDEKYNAQVDYNSEIADRDTCPKQERFYDKACENWGELSKATQKKVGKVICTKGYFAC